MFDRLEVAGGAVDVEDDEVVDTAYVAASSVDLVEDIVFDDGGAILPDGSTVEPMASVA